MAKVTPISLPLTISSNYTVEQQELLVIGEEFNQINPSFFTTSSYVEFHILKHVNHLHIV